MSGERARQPGGIGPGTAVGVAWLVSLGFDLFLHAGALATLYARPSPFLLPADAAFRRIPLGYSAFLVLTVALYWLFRQVGIKGWFVEMGIAGAFLGAAASGMARRRYLAKAAWAFGLLVVATVALQVTGLAPAMRTVGGTS